mmetsp:Transcript_18737/g.63815  ORF Transcript_18737/g.63815 Transcript_18737/m.63815 type:complete len:255 (+) Transcript_18737:2306-3070(+)
MVATQSAALGWLSRSARSPNQSYLCSLTNSTGSEPGVNVFCTANSPRCMMKNLSPGPPICSPWRVRHSPFLILRPRTSRDRSLRSAFDRLDMRDTLRSALKMSRCSMRACSSSHFLPPSTRHSACSLPTNTSSASTSIPAPAPPLSALSPNTPSVTVLGRAPRLRPAMTSCPVLSTYSWLAGRPALHSTWPCFSVCQLNIAAMSSSSPSGTSAVVGRARMSCMATWTSSAFFSRGTSALNSLRGSMSSLAGPTA